MALSKPEYKHNFQCIAEACLDLIKKPLKDILFSQIKPKELFIKVNSNYYLVNNLCQEQQNLCYISPPDLPDYSKFDVTLLCTLIRNLCPNLKPRKGWGRKPRESDTEIGHDIVRLRLFRNKTFAHSRSAAIPDDTFEALWDNLKSVLKRLKSHPECGVNYEKEMIEIRRSEFTYSKFETFKTLLQGLMNSYYQAQYGGVWITGNDEVICGYKAELKAKVERSSPRCLAIAWQRRRGNLVEIIDTTQHKYRGSTNTKLVIPSVCKEDAREYQASLSSESNGNKYTVSSNIIRLSVLGEIPFMEDLKVTNENEGITIYYSFVVSEKSPKVQDIKWSKNDQPLDMIYNKFSGGRLTDNCLVIKAPSADDKGKYSCTVKNAVGSVTKDIELNFPCVKISINPTPQSAQETTISSIVKSIPPPEKAQWQTSIDGNEFYDIDVTQQKYAGSYHNPESPYLVIPEITSDDIRFYRLQIWNKLGANVSNDVYLKFTGSLPNITISHETDFDKRSIKLKGVVVLSGDSPGIREVFWSKNGEKIDVHGSCGRLSGVTINDPSLTIKDVSKDDVGKYLLKARNAIGTNTSDVICLDIPSVNILAEKDRMEDDECKCFSVDIKSIPSATRAQWFIKSKGDDTFAPLDVHAAEYQGSTNSLPHPKLALKGKDQLERNCYQIEVTNFVGSTVEEISENIYRRDKIHFINLCDDLARHFPHEKIPRLKLYVYASEKLEKFASLKAAHTVLDVFNVLLEENIFSKNDVTFLQLLLKKTDCEELNKKCINYASTNRVCFFESDPVSGYINLKVHVNGDLNEYKQIEAIIEEIAQILNYDKRNIRIISVKPSTSVLLVLSIKEADTRKLLSMSEENQLKLRELNIDYMIVDKEILILDSSKGIVKEKSENKRDAGADFADFCDELAFNFPRQKLQKLKKYIKDSVILNDQTSLDAADSPFECFSLLLESQIFTKMDVMFMQLLLRKTGCQELYLKCLEFASTHDTVHYNEDPSDVDCGKVKVHMHGGSFVEIIKIKEVVAEIVGCSPEDIRINGVNSDDKPDLHSDEERFRSSKRRTSHLSQMKEFEATISDVDVSKSVESAKIGDEQNLKVLESLCQPAGSITAETNVKKQRHRMGFPIIFSMQETHARKLSHLNENDWKILDILNIESIVVEYGRNDVVKIMTGHASKKLFKY